MKRTNVCNIHKFFTSIDSKIHTTCMGIQKECCSDDTRHDVLCCHAFAEEPTCQYVSKQGCTVKSLRCALWFCSGDLFPYSGIQNGVFNSMGPTEAHPNRNFRIGIAVFPFMNKEHKEIYNEAKKYRFLRFFRQGKTMAVNYAYATRNLIEDDESIALTPEEYNNIEHDATENCPCALCYEDRNYK